MKTTICNSARCKFAGIIAIAAVIGLLMAGCDNGSPASSPPPPSTFTVTFDSAGGSAVANQSGIAVSGLATEPTAPTRAFVPSAAGLWAVSANQYTFGGWHLNGAPFAFTTPITGNITLTAQWSAPTAMTNVAAVAANDVAAAVTHINANPGHFTLLLSDNVTVTANSAIVAGVHLTVAGIDGRRTITRSGQGQMFQLNGADRSLTLGDNITLQGYITPEGARGNNGSMLHIAGGASLTMNPGAMITGNRTGFTVQGAVHVTGVGSVFTMNGGVIFFNESTAGNSGAGVRVAVGARFYMHPGAVIRNNSGSAGNNAAGVHVTGANSIFTMLGGEIHSNAVTDANSAGGVNVVANGAFRMVGGVIYGAGSANPNTSNPDHTDSFPVLRLDATGTAHSGTLDGSGNWVPASAVDIPVDGSGVRGTDQTIRVP